MVEDIATGRAEAADEALRAREIAAASSEGQASPPFALAAALAASAAAPR